MTEKKLVQALLDKLADADITLVPYRNYLAIKEGGVLAMCPESQTPCNSSCLFFSIGRRSIENEALYRVDISCRTKTIQIFIDVPL